LSQPFLFANKLPLRRRQLTDKIPDAFYAQPTPTRNSERSLDYGGRTVQFQRGNVRDDTLTRRKDYSVTTNALA
jgi:hypothetical protein